MAMDQPDAWIVGAHRNGDIPLLGEENDITPWRIVEVEILKAFQRIERGLVLRKNHDVVAVPVDRVRDCGNGDGWSV